MSELVSLIPAASDGRPVTVFFEFHRLQKVSRSYREAIRSLLASREGTFGDLLYVWSNDGDPDASYRSFPRNIEWKSLPTTDDAAVAHRFGTRDERAVALSGNEPGERMDPFVEAARHVIVSAEMRDTPRLRKLLAIWDKRAPGNEVQLHFFDGVVLTPAPEGYISSLRERYRAEEHFIWNWHLNWVLLCSRALAKVSTDEISDRMAYEAIAPSLGKGHNAIAMPIAMTIMFDLRRRGLILDGKDHKREIRHRDSGPVMDLPFIRPSPDHARLDLSYQGTGSYKSIAADGLVFDVISLHRTDPKWPLQFDNLDDVLCSLRWWRLVIMTEAGEMRLTSKGVRFLEIIGTSLDDPDMHLRWIDPSTGFWSPNAIPRIDRWLHKAFRAVKRRVAGLPAAPVVEVPKTKWPKWGERRFQVVYGRFKRISREMLADTEMAERIRQLDAASRSLPFRKRRFGIGRDSSCLGYEKTPFIFWVGLPVGVLSHKHVSWRTAGPLTDPEENARSASMLADMHDALFDGDWKCDLQFLGVEETDEECERFIGTSGDAMPPVDTMLVSDEDRARREGRPVVGIVVPNGVRYRN